MKKKMIRLMLLAVLIAPLGIAFQSCSSDDNNSGGGGTFFGFPVVDMAVGDSTYNTANNGAVYLWFDVLANAGPSLPAPDVSLDAGDTDPVRVELYNGDLYVAATDSTAATGGLLIFRDYMNASDGDTPDVVVYDVDDPLLGPHALQRLALEDDDLVATTWYGGDLGDQDGMYIWNNASTIANGDPPDLFLDDTSMGLGVSFSDCLQDVMLSGGRVYAASCNTGTDGAVGIWNSVPSVDTDAPDVLLTDDDNFIGLGYGMRTLAMDALGALYVGEYYGYTFYKFNDASGLGSNSLPDAVVTGGGIDSSYVTDLDTPNAMITVDNRLFVANDNQNLDYDFNAGVVAYDNISDLSQNQAPQVTLTRDVGFGSAERLATAGGALFISGAEIDDVGYYDKGIHIYKDAGSIATGQTSDLSLRGNQNEDISFLEYASGVSAIVRGTTDVQQNNNNPLPTPTPTP